MKKIILPTVATLLFCLIFPVSASAYFTTSQSAILLNENTILFSIKYSFGMNNSSLQMPIGARQNVEFNAEGTYLGYDLLSDGQPLSGAKVSGLVLSNAKIKDNEYSVPKGKAEEFQLVVIAQILDNDFQLDHNLSLKVTSLPFTIVNEGAEYSNHLNESELRLYRTPEIVTTKVGPL